MIFFKLFVFFLPTQLTYHFWPESAYIHGIRVDYLAPVIYFNDFIFLLFIVPFLVRYGSTIFKKYKTAIIVLIVFAAVNIAISISPETSIYRYVRVLQFLILMIYIRINKISIHSIKVPMLISLCFVLFLAFYQLDTRGSVGGIYKLFGERTFTQNTPGIALANIFGNEQLRPYSTFPHPNAMAGYALVCLWMFSHLKWRYRTFAVLVCVTLITVSYSQNAWISAFISIVIYKFIKVFYRVKLKFITSWTVSSYFLTIMKTAISMPRELVQRIELNQLSGIIISNNFIFGTGLGAFIHAIPVYSIKPTIWWLQPVHNVPLLITSETGIVGIILFLVLLLKSVNRHNFSFIIPIILLSMWDHYFVTIVQTNLLFAIALGYNRST